MENLSARFEQFEDEYIKFDRIESPLHNRPDMCAFLMLDKLIPGTGDIICASEHDEFYLDIDCEKFNELATDEQIRDLVRCGVRYDESLDSLCMYS